jgi:processive 1,2-diacylglycerol beta-glucosyltransferase
VKRILILTAGFGQGHNSAARGVRDGLAQVAPGQVEVELCDLFPETYVVLNELVRRTYLAVINQWPDSWGYVYDWLDGITNFDERFARFGRLKKHFAQVLDRFQPDVLVSTFPPYPYLLRQIAGEDRSCKSVVVITDSITVNAIWYQCDADYFLPSNEQSAAVVRRAGVAPEKIKVFGFPVSPQFGGLEEERQSRRKSVRPRILCVIHAGKKRAPEFVANLLNFDIDLTVAVGHDRRLRDTISRLIDKHGFEIIGWTNEMPRLLCRSHVLIGKAGGATVQETIAAACPMIVNHLVSGQEEGNARLIAETKSGVIALEPEEVAAQVRSAFADGARKWREWASNIAKLSRPRAALDIAQFLLSI